MRVRIGAALVVAGLWATGVSAQDKIEWTQVLNVDKGAHLPPGVRADILGIELGESYPAAKARADQLLSEGVQESASAKVDAKTAQLMGHEEVPPLREAVGGFSLPGPSGTNIEARYASGILLSREMKGSGNAPIKEFFEIQFSAPSSGQQVISIERRITYAERTDQVLIADVVKNVADKFKSQPQVFDGPIYRWQFSDRRPFVSKDGFLSCGGMARVQEHEVKAMNEQGECDVMLDVTFTPGVSDKHARGISFRLVDFERAKANQAADYEFFHGYVQSLVDGTAGAAPKL